MSVRLDGRAVDSIALGPAWRSCTAAGTRNVVALDSEAVASFAEETVLYLRQLEKHFGVSIRRIAIDAPSEPRADRLTRRLAETALDQRQISCFATPSAAEFEIIRGKVRDRLGEGGLESRPSACESTLDAGWLRSFSAFAVRMGLFGGVPTNIDSDD
jgi:hypothetical protein